MRSSFVRLLHAVVAAVVLVATVSSGVAGGCRMAHACASCPGPSAQQAWRANDGCAHMAPAAPRIAPTSFEPRLIATPAVARATLVPAAPQLKSRTPRAAAGLSVEASPPLVLRI